ADCIDYFCLTPRELLLSQAEKDQIPICFVAPLAFSATLLAFEKGSMSYKEYFAIDDTMDSFEKLLRISIAIAPKGLHQKYMNFTKEQLVEMQTGPSIAASIYLGGGLLAAEILFSLTNRRKLFSAPFYSQFDLLRGRYARGKLLWGNKGPIQRIKIWKARKDYISEKEAFLSFIK
ncbi:MAG: hypothetical protein KDD61_14020, partial [Bdellovibrionales bacterium]|nr:hypothetical protein [Bdellovibrionales bacterium]